jgi:hypothetical protein
MAKRARAKDVAQDRGAGVFWIDHAEILGEDYELLKSAERLTLWNVRVPTGFLARLRRLWWVDLRGGSASGLDIVVGADNLQYLAVNQVRGMRDLARWARLLLRKPQGSYQAISTLSACGACRPTDSCPVAWGCRTRTRAASLRPTRLAGQFAFRRSAHDELSVLDAGSAASILTSDTSTPVEASFWPRL